jgi:hypothetical protein
MTFGVTVSPTLTASTSNVAINAPTLTLTGTGFDPTVANDSVTFTTLGAAGTVSSVNGAGTQMTVTFTTPPTGIGLLKATVTSDGVATSNVQVGTVVDFADTFNRADAPTLGGNWEVAPLLPALRFQHRRLLGGFELQNDSAVSSAATPFTVSQVTGLSLLDPTLQADVNASNSPAVGLVARIQANGDAYVAALTNAGVAEILLYQAARNTYTVLQEASVPGGATSATLQFVVSGSTLSLFINGSSTPLLSVTNTAQSTAGGVGLFAQGAAGIIEDFSVTGF